MKKLPTFNITEDFRIKASLAFKKGSQKAYLFIAL